MLKLSCLALPVLLFFAGDLPAAEPSFTPLPDLPGGEASAFVHALSANGEVAVGSSNGAWGRSYPFRWTRETGIVALGEVRGLATDVSADGAVVAGFQESPKPTAFRWAADLGIVHLQSVGEFGYSYAWGVSEDGGHYCWQQRQRRVLRALRFFVWAIGSSFLFLAE